MQWQGSRELSLKRADVGDHLRSDQFLKQALFVFEVQINRALGDTGALGNVIESRCGKNTGGKFIKHGVKNRVSPFRRPGSSSSAGPASFSVRQICCLLHPSASG